MKRLDKTEFIFKILSYALLTIFALACLYPFIYILVNSISSKIWFKLGIVFFYVNCRELSVNFLTANFTNFAKLAQVNWGRITRIFLRYRRLRAMDWFMLTQVVF